MRYLFLFLCLVVPVSAQSVWTVRSAPAHFTIARPAGKPGVYLVPTEEIDYTLLTQQYLRSSDGVAWEFVTLPMIGNELLFVCMNGRFVGAAGDGGVWVSDDGKTGRLTRQSGSDRYEGIAYGNGVWVISMTDGRVLRSATNGDSWEEFVTPAAQLQQVVFGGGKFIITGSGFSLTGTDGKTWAIAPEVSGNYLTFEAGRWQTHTSYSTDGTTWTSLSGSSRMPDDAYILRSGGGQFLTWNFETQPKFYTSTGGVWTPALSGVAETIVDATFCGDLWVAVTETKILTSPTPVLPAPAAPPLNISPAVRLSWASLTGRSYIIQRSTNQTTWTDLSGVILGTGATVEWLAPATASREFFRVQVR